MCKQVIELSTLPGWNAFIAFVHNLVSMYAVAPIILDRAAYYKIPAFTILPREVQDQVCVPVRAKFKEVGWFQHEWVIAAVAQLKINSTNNAMKSKENKENRIKVNNAQVAVEITVIQGERIPELVASKLIISS